MLIDDITQMGAWRMLCAAALHDAVVITAKKKCSLEDRLIIKHWLEQGDVGAVTFHDCCESMGYDPEILRAKIAGVKGRLLRKPAFKRQPTLYECDQEEAGTLCLR